MMWRYVPTQFRCLDISLNSGGGLPVSRANTVLRLLTLEICCGYVKGAKHSADCALDARVYHKKIKSVTCFQIQVPIFNQTAGIIIVNGLLILSADSLTPGKV